MPRKGRSKRQQEPVDSDSDLDRSLYQPLAGEGNSIDEGPIDGAGTWASRGACIIVVVLFAGVAAIASVTWGIIPDHHRTNVYACRKTHLYPSRLACPTTSECRHRRPFLSKKTQFHRVDVGWNFPLLGIHNVHRVEAMEDEKVAKLFRLPPRVVRTFLYIEDRLENSVSTRLRDIHQVREKLPKDIRVPISHLCCLTKEEMMRTGPAVKAWTESRNFSTHLDFTHVECWQESSFNVENSLIADLTSQRHLLELNHELSQWLVRANVPVIVRRVEQLKFRIPLVGFYTRYSKNSIRPMLRSIADSVADVNRAFELNMQIERDPTVAYGNEMTL